LIYEQVENPDLSGDRRFLIYEGIQWENPAH